MRCPYCGNENPADHRFCGMCGRPLVANTVGESREPAREHEAEPPNPAPAYTGGLFNLNVPADKPHRSLDYLLEDDEESKSNKGVIFLCLLALLLVVGLGWLRWRNVSLPDWFKKQTSPATTTVPAAPATSETTPASDTSSSIQPVSSPEVPSTTAPSDPSNPTPSPSTPSPSITPIESSGTAATTPTSPAAGEDSKASTSPASTKDTVEASEPAKEKEAETPPKSDAAKAKVAPSKTTPKAATKAPDQVTLGEQYLYGRGVPQNCERGLRLVKPAAEQSNPKAMITMGALYATGHCISRDLPTAYRFFALALRNDPENGPLRQNAEMVWKQMTAEERKQAIRMTQ